MGALGAVSSDCPTYPPLNADHLAKGGLLPKQKRRNLLRSLQAVSADLMGLLWFGLELA